MGDRARALRCACAAFSDSTDHAPTSEQDAGRVRIVSTSEPGWSMTYLVECTACGRRFTVKQIDGPALQWTWTEHGVKRKRTAD